MERKHWLDDPRNVWTLIWALVAVCGILLLLDLFYEKHVHFWFEALFGFYAFYGFGACVALVLIAKQLRKLLARPEDYYGDTPDDHR